jgi:cellulose synthase/poly-beta-1,6-N-acetylglucosamine synthase-like glycosyltransferase
MCGVDTWSICDVAHANSGRYVDAHMDSMTAGEEVEVGVELPVVSLVVIGFNEEANIASCLATVFAQRFPGPFEVIVVDDASTDATVSIVEDLQSRYPQLRLLRHPENRGRGAARRTGQNACRAAMIGFIDSDIRLPEDWLIRATSALEDADVVSGVAVPDGDCAVIWRIFGPTPKGMHSYWELTGNNVLFRRSALELVGWPAETRLTEDNRMAKALVAAGLKVRTVQDLHVEHHEGKSYRKALAYMHETGMNATEILRDLRVFRFPDLVWVCWVVAVVGAVVLAVIGIVGWWLAASTVVLLTVAIDLGAMHQRFYFRSHPWRWIAAACANLPMITTYLASRTFYAPRLLQRPHVATH